MSGLERYTREQLEGAVIEQSKMIADLLSRVSSYEEMVGVLQTEVERLKSHLPGGKTPAPSWAKASVKKPEEKTERRKRIQSFTRKRQTPTETRVHVAEECPDCKRKLSGGWVHRRREVIDIPPSQLLVTEHLIMARYCGVCKKRCIPAVDLSSEVMGAHRVGIRLMSFIAWLSVEGRVPLRRIQALLHSVYGLDLGVGELSEILHAIAKKGKAIYDGLGAEILQSACVHADETGWRQDGVNGYIWGFVTPTARYFLYDKSRAHAVPQAFLGTDYAGVLVSDFYGGYNFHEGLHQRCWVHLLRDMSKLVEDHPDDEAVAAFAASLRSVYDRARAFVEKRSVEPDVGYRSERERTQARVSCEEEAMALARPFLKTELPQRVLAQRIETFLKELFTFVEYKDVPSENNAAERAIRPCVIARKVSGGTRSEKGSTTRMTLISLFASWRAKGNDLLPACHQMLRNPA